MQTATIADGIAPVRSGIGNQARGCHAAEFRRRSRKIRAKATFSFDPRSQIRNPPAMLVGKVSVHEYRMPEFPT